MRQKVLVIDDEKDLCDLILKILSQTDYETDCAHNLKDGKQKWEEWKPDIVLLDNNLPDGIALDLLEMNRDLVKKSIVIMITADTRTETMERASLFGIPAIVAKPFTMTEIRKVVHSLRA